MIVEVEPSKGLVKVTGSVTLHIDIDINEGGKGDIKTYKCDE